MQSYGNYPKLPNLFSITIDEKSFFSDEHESINIIYK